MKCPTCQGEGKVNGIGCGPGGCRPVIIRCYDCSGVGTVSDDFAERRASGESRRQERLSRGASLREEATRLNISPQVLSRLERGLE